MADDTTNKRWPGESDEAHPDTFNVAPPRLGAAKPGQLTDEQIKHFFEKVGFDWQKIFDDQYILLHSCTLLFVYIFHDVISLGASAIQ